MRVILFFVFLAAANAARLLRTTDSIPGRYIVKIKSGVEVQSILPSVRLAGGRVDRVYKRVFNGFAAELSDEVLDIVLNLPAVEYVEEDGIARTMAVASWGLDRIDQQHGTDGTYNPPEYLGNGAGRRVYVLDTGIQVTHQDFGGRAIWGTNVVDKRNEDCNGHGTHCAGTVGGTQYGVAKGVTLIAVKVLNCQGSGSWTGIIAGMDWVATNAADSGEPSVASMSLGGGISGSVDNAVNNLVASGIPTSVAAGNSDADACNYSPARAVSAVTVGSTDVNDNRSSFSNWGTCVDIFAPGSSITSAWIDGKGKPSNPDNASNTISGTSMACPHVAGAIALMGEQNVISKASQGVVNNADPNNSELKGNLLYVA